jgi:peptide deformylase
MTRIGESFPFIPNVRAEAVKILRYPNPLLAQKAAPVERVEPETRAIVQRMMATMLMAPGFGLAAPQIGVMRRILTVDPGRIGNKRELSPLALLNPSIAGAWENKTEEEGCLSLPGTYAPLARPSRIRIEYMDLEWEPQTLDADGYLARCILHEMDHLDGILFWERLPIGERALLKSKYFARLTWLG